MKTGRTLVEMAQELERQKNAKRDFTAPTTHLEVIPTNKEVNLKVNGFGEFPINNVAHGQIAARVGIPQKYYDRMVTEAPELLARNVNHWFKAKDEGRMVRTLDGKARAFLSDRYRPLDNYDLGNMAFGTIGELGGLRIESAQLTDTRMYIKAVTERITAEISKGDVVQAGIVISNSEVGLGSVKVEPMVYRLVCTNGLIANDHALRKYHVGRGFEAEIASELFTDATRNQTDKAFWMQVRDVIRNSFKQDVFDRIVNSMKISTTQEIVGDPIKVVEITQKRLGLMDSEKSSVLTHLIKGGDLSKWGLVNAVTRTAEDVESYDRATELERLGGVVLELPAKDWKEIAEAA